MVAVAAAPPFEDVSRSAAGARQANRLTEAIELYRDAVKLKPEWDEGWWYLATLLYETDRCAEARDAFARFLSLKPQAGPGWVLRGLCDFDVGEHAAALEHIGTGLSRGVADNPEVLRAGRYHQALLFVRAGQFELAVAPLTALARAQGESSGLVEAIGLMMLRMPLLPAEVPEARRALVRRAGRAGYLHLARKGDQAAQAFAELVAAHPAEPWVHYAHGVFLLTRDSERALAALRRETEVQPGAVYAHLEIAFERLRRGDNVGARASAEKAVTLAPGLFAAQNALGRALVELGELDRGIAALEAAVRLAPDSPEMHYSLARAYAKARRPEEAARERALFAELEKKKRAERGEPIPDAPAPEEPRP